MASTTFTPSKSLGFIHDRPKCQRMEIRTSLHSTTDMGAKLHFTQHLHWIILFRHIAHVLFWYVLPVLCCLHHLGTIENTKSKAMVDVVTSSVDRPPTLFVVGYSCCFHHDMLHIAPGKVGTERQAPASQFKTTANQPLNTSVPKKSLSELDHTQ